MHGENAKENSQIDGTRIRSNVRLSCCSLRPTPFLTPSTLWLVVLISAVDTYILCGAFPAFGTVLPRSFLCRAICLTGVYLFCLGELFELSPAVGWSLAYIDNNILYCILRDTYHTMPTRVPSRRPRWSGPDAVHGARWGMVKAWSSRLPLAQEETAEKPKKTSAKTDTPGKHGAVWSSQAEVAIVHEGQVSTFSSSRKDSKDSSRSKWLIPPSLSFT